MQNGALKQKKVPFLFFLWKSPQSASPPYGMICCIWKRRNPLSLSLSLSRRLAPLAFALTLFLAPLSASAQSAAFAGLSLLQRARCAVNPLLLVLPLPGYCPAAGGETVYVPAPEPEKSPLTSILRDTVREETEPAPSADGSSHSGPLGSGGSFSAPAVNAASVIYRADPSAVTHAELEARLALFRLSLPAAPGQAAPSAPSYASYSWTNPARDGASEGWVESLVEPLSVRIDSLAGVQAGQWASVDGGLSYTGGNVGIGTTTPAARLIVQHPTLAAFMTSDGASLKFFRPDTTSTASGKSFALVNGNPPTSDGLNTLVFQVRSATDTFVGNLMGLAADGKLILQPSGVGYLHDDSRLTVANTNATSSQINLRSVRAAMSAGHVVGGISFSSNDSNLANPGIVTASIQALANTAHTASALGTDLAFMTTNGTTTAEALRILGNGNVGIGTTTPQDLFTVVGTTTASTFKAISNRILSWNGSNLLSLNNAVANIAFGPSAFQNIETATGSLNTAFGYSSLQSMNSGSGNTGFGRFTVSNTTSGDFNTGFGLGALQLNVTGSNNTAVGRNALRAVTGSNNLGLGYQAADNLTSGSNNLVIGYDIDAPSATASNQLNIGNIIFGTGIDGTGTTLSSGNIGIGTTTPGSKLTVAGTSLFTGASSFSGNLTVGGGLFLTPGASSGTLYSDSGNILTTPAGFNITGGGFFMQSIQRISSSGNASFNAGAFTGGVGITLDSASTALTISRPGTGNTLTFDHAGGVSNINASGDLVIKNGVAEALRTRGSASAFGGDTTPDFRLELQGPAGNGYFGITNVNDGDVFVVDGSGNVGIGTTTPTGLLTVKGSSAYYHNFSGGIFALTNGSDERFGFASNGASVYGLPNNENGGAIRLGISGTMSYLGTTGGNVNLYAGSTVTPAMSWRSNGNVGIGTTTPTAKLSVVTHGAAMQEAAEFANSNLAHPINIRLGTVSGFGPSGGYAAIQAGRFPEGDRGLRLIGRGQNENFAPTSIYLDGTGGAISFNTNTLAATGTERMRITSSGNVGIGTTTPGQKLSVDGSILSTGLLGGSTNLTVDANGVIIRDPSDRNLKQNVSTIENALDKVSQLRGVSYEWLDKARYGTSSEIGVIAQEVELVVPEVVSSGGAYKSVKIANLVGLLIEAVKELKVKVDALASGIFDDITAQNVKADMLCLEDVCINKQQLQQILLNGSVPAGLPVPPAPTPVADPTNEGEEGEGGTVIQEEDAGEDEAIDQTQDDAENETVPAEVDSDAVSDDSAAGSNEVTGL